MKHKTITHHQGTVIFNGIIWRCKKSIVLILSNIICRFWYLVFFNEALETQNRIITRQKWNDFRRTSVFLSRNSSCKWYLFVICLVNLSPQVHETITNSCRLFHWENHRLSDIHSQNFESSYWNSGKFYLSFVFFLFSVFRTNISFVLFCIQWAFVYWLGKGKYRKIFSSIFGIIQMKRDRFCKFYDFVNSMHVWLLLFYFSLFLLSFHRQILSVYYFSERWLNM